MNNFLPSVELSDSIHKTLQAPDKGLILGVASSTLDALISSIELITGLVLAVLSALVIQGIKSCGGQLPKSIEKLPATAARHALTGLFSFTNSLINLMTFTIYNRIRPENGFSSIPLFL